MADLNNYDIEIVQGASFALDITFPKTDLTGFFGKSQVRRFPGHPEVILELAVEIVNATKGAVKITATPESTKSLDFANSKYYYDLLIISPGGQAERKLSGRVTLMPTITQYDN